MSVSREIDDFMQSMVPVQESVQEQPVVDPVQEQPVAAPVDAGIGEPQSILTEPTNTGPTPEQVELERLRQEVKRLSVDHELANFESGLKRTTDTYLSTKQQSIDTAFARNRELIDKGEPEQAERELRDFWAKMELADNNMRGYVQTQRVEFARKREHAELGPQYAKHLGQVHGLSAEDVALLSKFDGFTQDKMIGDIAARNRAVKSNEARLRDLEASVRAQSGAFAPGGTTGSAVPPQSQRPTDPLQAEMWDFMQSPLIPSGGRR